MLKAPGSVESMTAAAPQVQQVELQNQKYVSPVQGGSGKLDPQVKKAFKNPVKVMML